MTALLLGVASVALLATNCSTADEVAGTPDQRETDQGETDQAGSAAETKESTAPTAIPTAVPTATPDPGGLKLLAHRGLHQTYTREGLERDTCTATRIYPPDHEYLENTLASIEAAFAAGAAVVEIDIAPSSDGVLAVFHDWEVGCRTDGEGEIRSLSWAQLSALDIGYGYTADGETYPFRGQGVGLMPRLEDVFDAFPDGRFLINFKSGNPVEADLLNEVVTAQDAADQVWAVYGGQGAVEAYLSLTRARGFTEQSVLSCFSEYLAAEGAEPTLPACQDALVAVPLDFAPLLTGWPDEFFETMARHNADVIITGPDRAGLDTREALEELPSGIDAYVWTNRIEILTEQDQ